MKKINKRMKNCLLTLLVFLPVLISSSCPGGDKDYDIRGVWWLRDTVNQSPGADYMITFRGRLEDGTIYFDFANYWGSYTVSGADVDFIIGFTISGDSKQYEYHFTGSFTDNDHMNGDRSLYVNQAFSFKSPWTAWRD